jgi:Tfp pilus assembly protein PilZ
MKARDRYHVEGASCRLADQMLWITNLSVGGLFAATQEPPLRGQVVALDLLLPDHRQLSVLGQVTWVNSAGGSMAPHLPQGFGARIVRISLPDKVALLDVLKRQGRPVREDDRPHALRKS